MWVHVFGAALAQGLRGAVFDQGQLARVKDHAHAGVVEEKLLVACFREEKKSRKNNG